MSEPHENKLPEESIEEYAKRLERRIKEQRDTIKAMQELGAEGSKVLRVKHARLERMFAQACEAAQRRKDQRDSLALRYRALKADFELQQGVAKLWNERALAAEAENALITGAYQ